MIGETCGVVNCVGKVIAQRDIFRARDNAPHVLVAGPPTVSPLNMKLHAGTTVLCATDVEIDFNVVGGRWSFFRRASSLGSSTPLISGSDYANFW